MKDFLKLSFLFCGTMFGRSDVFRQFFVAVEFIVDAFDFSVAVIDITFLVRQFHQISGIRSDTETHLPITSLTKASISAFSVSGVILL